MKTQIVIGANYGDEGKGLVSGCLAREAYRKGEKALTIFYNGTSQRAHTFCGRVFRSIAGGSLYGSDTFYYEKFVVDPISFWISGSRPIVDGRCRVILPCDVIKNRNKEKQRGDGRHGSCGFGLFECVKRCENDGGSELEFTMYDLKNLSGWRLYKKLKAIEGKYGKFDDDLYNMDNLMMAIDWIKNHIRIDYDLEVIGEYDTVIFEGGQGLLLDQNNKQDFPHLTPSSTGSTQICKTVRKIALQPEIYYVTRSYMTRHGAGPMEAECKKEDINPDIVDKTNQPNEFQGDLRFGKIDTTTLFNRIRNDELLYLKNPGTKVNLVVTQLNYTDGKMFTAEGLKPLEKPVFCNHLFGSNCEDEMFMIE